jgi:hypothetical protein
MRRLLAAPAGGAIGTALTANPGAFRCAGHVGSKYFLKLRKYISPAWRRS